ncbi:hypothetical protein Daesc_003477 [Daldinia eschscholtzii]|uniref:Uncharacterized protein n=1 Tax=Daldinia eschscholtzii TaxID=292717 RepID=A0AAX6MTS9_9PEZI
MADRDNPHASQTTTLPIRTNITAPVYALPAIRARASLGRPREIQSSPHGRHAVRKQGNYECAPTSSSYSYPWGPTLGCMSVYRINTELAFTTIDGTLKGDEEAGSLTSVFAPGTIMAYGVVIQNSPTTTTAETATATPESSSSNSVPVSETSASISATAEPQPGSNGGTKLSAGAAAGIGIGAAFAVLALGAAVLWMFWSRRRKRRQEAAELQAQASMVSPGNWSSTTWNAPPSTQQPVMQANWQPSELANEHGYKEMSAEPWVPIEADSRAVYQR